MSKYCLFKHPSSYYLAQFNIKIAPYLSTHYLDGCEYLVCELGEPDYLFDVTLECDKGVIRQNDIELAREILSQIIEMDSMARSIFAPEDKYDEYGGILCNVIISNSEIEFYYQASLCNTDWRAYFTRDENGIFHFESLG